MHDILISRKRAVGTTCWAPRVPSTSFPVHVPQFRLAACLQVCLYSRNKEFQSLAGYKLLCASSVSFLQCLHQGNRIVGLSFNWPHSIAFMATDNTDRYRLLSCDEGQNHRNAVRYADKLAESVATPYRISRNTRCGEVCLCTGSWQFIQTKFVPKIIFSVYFITQL